MSAVEAGTGASQTYDGRGNLTTGGFSYDVYNRLTAAPGMTSLGYDPAGRLYETVAGGATTRFLYDGDEIIAEYNGAGTLQRRYVPGPGLDEPAAWYEGAGVSDRRWLVQDECGSAIGWANAAGALGAAYAYDEYGQPSAWGSVGSAPRLRYAGAVALPEAQLYSMRARVYSPSLGRFLQTDPILHAGGMNLYAYVQNDPVNFIDPFGLEEETTIDVWGRGPGPQRPPPDPNSLFPGTFDRGILINADGSASGAQPGTDVAIEEEVIVVTAQRRERNEVGNFFLGLIPGYSLLQCGLTGCSALDWTFAVLDVVPAGRVAGLAGRAVRSCFCFEAGTLVATPEGLRAIEDIAVGDTVLAWNPETGQTTMQTVTALIRPEPQATYELVLRDAGSEREVFVASDNHPWFVVGKGWVETLNLAPGDRIVSGRGADLVVETLTPTGRMQQTYNLTVDGPHTFLVGEDGVVVHNAPCERLARIAQQVFRQGNVAGLFSVFRRDPVTGRINAYQTFTPNPRHPMGIQPGDRFRGAGDPHGRFIRR